VIWDRWYMQPWAWIWSELERLRLGPGRLLAQQLVTWVVPWAALGALAFGWFGAEAGWIGGALTMVGIPRAVRAARIRLARRHGWEAVYWVPASWRVWTETARWLGVDADPQAPHWERHTQVRRWARPGDTPRAAATRFRVRRAAEVRAQAARSGPAVLISMTYATLGGLPPSAVRVPWPTLLRQPPRTLARVQRCMFGGVVPLAGGRSVADDQTWRVTWLKTTVPMRYGDQQHGEEETS